MNMRIIFYVVAGLEYNPEQYKKVDNMKQTIEFVTSGGNIDKPLTCQCNIDFEGATVDDLKDRWLSSAIIATQCTIRKTGKLPVGMNGATIAWDKFVPKIKTGTTMADFKGRLEEMLEKLGDVTPEEKLAAITEWMSK